MRQPDEDVRLANAVLWPGFLGEELPRWLQSALRDGLAGVVYFSQNLHGDTLALSDSIHAVAPAALIGVDEEGGSVTRLESSTGSTLPGAAELGALDDVRATYATGREIGRRVAAVGADVVIAPVADVNTDPRNPVIGVRAFGSQTALVSRHVAAAVAGIQSTGIAACAKHYPGHGDTHTDSHHDLPRVHLSREHLEQVHLPPFRAAVGAGVRAIMTAHIASEEWGDDPATLNADVLGRLRADGFTGVIITDALDMAAIRESVGIGGGAVRALAAGADLLCVGNPTNPRADWAENQDERDYHEARDAIVAALRSGALPRARVQEAAQRVAAMAARVRAREAVPAPGMTDAAGFEVAPFDGPSISAGALQFDGARPHLPDRPTAVIDLRRASSLAVDSAAAHVAATLAHGGTILRIDAHALSETELAGAVLTAQAGPTIVLVDRLEPGEAQRTLRDRLRADAPGIVTVNVGLRVQGAGDDRAPVVTASASSLLAATTVRRALVTPQQRPSSAL